MIRTFIMILAFVSFTSGEIGSAHAVEWDAPGEFLVVSGVLLGVADSFLCLGNFGDVRKGEASRGRGVLGTTLGTITVLLAVGTGVGTEATEFAVGLGIVGLATTASSIWAISKSDTSTRISLMPSASRDAIGLMVRYQW